MMVQGKVVISTMVLVGLSMAAFAWWARYWQSQQVLAIWGPEAVVAIRTGKQVELLRLVANGEDDSEVLLVGEEGTPLHVQQSVDISETAGLIHARHHLIHPKGFLWEALRPEDCRPEWSLGMRFVQAGQPTTLAFDFRCQRAFLVERETEVGMTPLIADALQTFLEPLSLRQESAP